jgi:hypothetical protein
LHRKTQVIRVVAMVPAKVVDEAYRERKRTSAELGAHPVSRKPELTTNHLRGKTVTRELPIEIWAALLQNAERHTGRENRPRFASGFPHAAQGASSYDIVVGTKLYSFIIAPYS